MRGIPAAIAALMLVAESPRAALAQPEAPPAGADRSMTIEPRPARLERRLRFQIVDQERGLPQNSVASIVQDATGFMWLATQDGLARYDGQRFVVFRHDPDDANSVSNSFITELLATKDGTVWVGTGGGGLNRYDSKTGKIERFPGDLVALKEGTLMAMSEGRDGKIWIATNGDGLAVIDPATGQARGYSAEDGLTPELQAVHASADGIVWIGSASGLFRFDPANPKQGFELLFSDHKTLGTTIVSALFQDSKGDLWIGTAGEGLARYNPATKKLQEYKAAPDDPDTLLDGEVYAIYEDRAGRFWVATEEALHLMDRETGRFQRYRSDFSDTRSLPKQPRDVIQDAAGVLWVATNTGGAALLDPRVLQIEYYKTSAAGAFVVDGKDLWVSTFEGICRWRNMGEGVCYPGTQALSLLLDRSGTLWAGTPGQGLLRHDAGAGDRWIRYKPDPQDPGSVAPGIITQVYEDRSGQIWLAAIGGGLQRFDRATQSFTTHPLPSASVYTIKQDPNEDGVLWLGTADIGLLKVNVTKLVKPEQFAPAVDDLSSKTDNSIPDFVFDKNNAIWLATYGGGLKRFDRATKTFTHYRRKDGLPSDNVYSLFIDQKGLLWMSSQGGLARFDPGTKVVHVFTAADGLQSNEFALKSAAAFPDGRMAFGGINGFNIVRPDIEIDTYKPPVVLTAFRVFGQPYDTGGRPVDSLKEVSLDHDEDSVTIEFAGLSYSASNDMQFEYQFGGSGRWLSSESGVLSLAGLRNGEYDLLVRARNRHGVVSEERKLVIDVAPPPWLTWWAIGIYVLAALGVLFSIYRYQQARIDRLQKLARLATVEREFEVTAAVQSWFLPEHVTYRTGAWDLVGFYRGAEKCSGDWWWYEEVDAGKLWIIVADVTGHGAGPAMLTAAVAMGLSVQVDAQEGVIERLTKVNREVLSRCKGKATMTMTAAVLDLESGEVVVYGLGGLPALLFGAQGKHSVIGASGTPLGSVENLAVGEKSVRLHPGDRLLITTDGIVEATLAGGRQLGFRRFIGVVREAQGMPLDRAVERIVVDVDRARGGQAQEDDFTFCVIERRAS